MYWVAQMRRDLFNCSSEPIRKTKVLPSVDLRASHFNLEKGEKSLNRPFFVQKLVSILAVLMQAMFVI